MLICRSAVSGGPSGHSFGGPVWRPLPRCAGTAPAIQLMFFISRTQDVPTYFQHGGTQLPSHRHICAQGINCLHNCDGACARSGSLKFFFPVCSQNVDKWSFDVFALNEASGDHALKFIFYELLTRYDLISRFKVSNNSRCVLLAVFWVVLINIPQRIG